MRPRVDKRRHMIHKCLKYWDGECITGPLNLSNVLGGIGGGGGGVGSRPNLSRDLPITDQKSESSLPAVVTQPEGKKKEVSPRQEVQGEGDRQTRTKPNLELDDLEEEMKNMDDLPPIPTPREIASRPAPPLQEPKPFVGSVEGVEGRTTVPIASREVPDVNLLTTRADRIASTDTIPESEPPTVVRGANLEGRPSVFARGARARIPTDAIKSNALAEAQTFRGLKVATTQRIPTLTVNLTDAGFARAINPLSSLQVQGAMTGFPRGVSSVAGLSSDYRISNVTRLDSTGFVDSAPVYQETAGYASAYPIAEASTVEAIGASTAEAIGAVALL